MPFEVKVLANHVGVDAPRLLTFELYYPRFIHAEFMTHRVFSRNASSSRAIPFEKMKQALLAEIALPAEWRMNQPGMQGYEVAGVAASAFAERIYRDALVDALKHAQRLADASFHKQHVNRLLEPFAHIRTVVTGTQWANFFALRDHPAADPTIQMLAREMKAAVDETESTQLSFNQWSLPYVDDEASELCIEFVKTHSILDLDDLGIRGDDQNLTIIEVKKRVSAARCARTSYRLHDGKPCTVEKDLALYTDSLMEADLIHASPTEHQATPDRFLINNQRWMSPRLHGNLNGWVQFRKQIPNENVDVIVGSEY